MLWGGNSTGILAFTYGGGSYVPPAPTARKGNIVRYQYQHKESRYPSVRIPQFIFCDGEIDLPVNDVAQGDLAYTKDTDTLWKRTAGYDWAQVATGGGGGGAPTDAAYITKTPNASLSAEQALSLLATGVLKSTTGTGVISTAILSDLTVALRPAQITANQNNYAPGVCTALFLTTDAAWTITGLVAGLVDGETREIWNVGTEDITLAHENAGSAAANRFACQGGADIVLPGGFKASLSCDLTAARWRVVAE